MNKNENKIKRMSFIEEEDIYFLTYNSLIFLNELSFDNKRNYFKDYRKLGIIIVLISDENFFQYFLNYYKNDDKKNINIDVKKDLKGIYFKILNNNEKLKYILLSLEKKGFITLIGGEKTTNLYLNSPKKIKEMFDNNIFDDEKSRILLIKRLEKKIRTLKYDSFIKNIFDKSGVETWEI